MNYTLNLDPELLKRAKEKTAKRYPIRQTITNQAAVHEALRDFAEGVDNDIRPTSRKGVR